MTGGRVETLAGRWGTGQVLGLATDTSSVRAGQALGRASVWSDTGSSERAVWGACRGSGARPYQTAVDLTRPAFRCTCPSRKFPCKHALGLLLLWSAGEVGSEEEPSWVADWVKGAAAAPKGPTQSDPEAARQRAARRAERVASGVAELESWLTDRIRRGLAGFEQRGYDELDRLAARMVDAQAPGLAGAVRRAAGVIGRGSGWPGALLEELALIHLTVAAYGRLDELPGPLAETVRSRIGWTVETARVLAEGEGVDDDWLVLGQVVEPDERLTVRCLWLHGLTSRRPGLVLSFAPAGRQLDVLPGAPGEVVRGRLAYYPGALPLRGLLTPTDEPRPPVVPGGLSEDEPRPPVAPGGSSDEEPRPPVAPGGSSDEEPRPPVVPGGQSEEEPRAPVVPDGVTIRDALASYAGALARDPWGERWPFVLAGVRPARSGDGWALVDTAGDALELVRWIDPWPLLAVSAGEPLTVAGEWSRAGLRPITCWHAGRAVALS